MANRLKAYVRRTLLAAARDYATGNRRTPDSTRAACEDALRGTDTGWWTDLVYTADVLKMAHRYRRDIATALEEYEGEVGEPYKGPDGITAGRICLALLRGRPYTFEEYRDGRDGSSADAALLGLRFAVEWYAGEVANELTGGRI